MTEIDHKERIRLHATDLFMKYGVRSVSMDDIANNLGISKKTIYQYYSDKNELVDAVIVEEISLTETCCEADRFNSENAVHELFLAMDMVAEMFRSMNPFILFDIQKYHPNAFLKFNKHKNNFLYNIIHQNLQRGIQEELYRADINIDIVARFRIETMLLSFNPVFTAELKNNMAEIEEEIILHYLHGLVNMKGHKLIVKYKQEREKKIHNHAKNK